MLNRFGKRLKTLLSSYGQSIIVLEYNHRLDKGNLDFICDSERQNEIKDVILE